MSGNMPAPRKPLVSSYFQKWNVVPGAAMLFVMETTRNSAHTYGSTLYGVRLVVSVSVGVPLGVPVRRGGGSQVHGRNSVLENMTIRRGGVILGWGLRQAGICTHSTCNEEGRTAGCQHQNWLVETRPKGPPQ